MCVIRKQKNIKQLENKLKVFLEHLHLSNNLNLKHITVSKRSECGDLGCLDSAHQMMMTDIIPPQMSQKFLMILGLES